MGRGGRNERTYGVGDINAANATEVGRCCGVTRQAVQKWKCPRRPDGKYCIPEVVQWRIEKEAMAADLSSGAKSPQLERWRRARADMAEDELARRRGDLVEVVEVEAKWGRLLTALRQQLTRLGTSVAMHMPASGRGKARRVVEEEVAGALNRVVREYRDG